MDDQGAATNHVTDSALVIGPFLGRRVDRREGLRDTSGRVRTCLDVSGRVWTCLDVSGRVRTCLDVSGRGVGQVWMRHRWLVDGGFLFLFFGEPSDQLWPLLAFCWVFCRCCCCCTPFVSPIGPHFEPEQEKWSHRPLAGGPRRPPIRRHSELLLLLLLLPRFSRPFGFVLGRSLCSSLAPFRVWCLAECPVCWNVIAATTTTTATTTGSGFTEFFSRLALALPLCCSVWTEPYGHGLGKNRYNSIKLCKNVSNSVKNPKKTR